MARLRIDEVGTANNPLEPHGLNMADFIKSIFSSIVGFIAFLTFVGSISGLHPVVNWWKKDNFAISAIGNHFSLKGALAWMACVATFIFFTWIFERSKDDDATPSPQPVPQVPEPVVQEEQEPEDPAIVKARKLAEIEKEKAEHMARIRIAEARGLAEVAAEVAQNEEERQRRQFEDLKKL